MALTVEELQIVLKCDATTAQEVLKQMDATVKAYTEKFQKYFQTRTGKVQPLDNVAKQVDSAVREVESQTKRLKKAAADWKEQYKKTWGEDFDSSMMKAKIRSSVDRMGKEYKPSGQKYVGSGGGMGDPNYYKNSQFEYSRMTGPYSNANGGVPDLGLKSTSFSEAFATARTKAQAFFQELGLMAQYAGGKIGSAIKAGAHAGIGAVKLVGRTLSGIVGAARKVGGAIKKAFQASLLGRFLKQLGRTMLRMAAMKLIQGVIQGIKAGLDDLAKHSKSSAKAMNTLKGAGNSIKMSLGMAVMPIIKALAPTFVTLAGVVNAACNAIARFFAVVTGQGTYTAVNFSNALDGVSDSADGAGKSAKRAVAAFDELNVIGQQGGGGGGGTDVTNPFSSVTGDLPAFSELGTKIREAIEKGDWREVGSAIAGKLNEAIDSWHPEESAHKISDGIKNALDAAVGFLEDIDWHMLGAKLKTFFEEIDWNGIMDKLSEGIGALAGGIGVLLVELFGDAWQAVKDWFYSYSFNEDGQFVFEGFLEGIKDVVEKIDAWIDEHIVKPFIDGFKKAFGIASPAKEMNEPGDMVGQGILEGIAAPFKAIGTWLNDHIVQPIKDWFSEHALNIDFDFQLPDLSSFKATWDKLKGGTKTFTAKLSGVKDSVIQKVQENWNKITDKTADLKANIQEGIETKVASIKTAWNDLKAGTKNLTANLSGAGVTAFEKLKTAWSGIITKTSTMTASLSQNFTQTQLDNLKNAWNGIKESVTSKFTASLNVGATVQNFIDKWNALTDKKVTIQAVSDKFKETWNSIAAKWNASSFLRGIFTMPTLASGGVTYGPTMAMIGEYAGAKSNPEVIAPLSTLVGLLQRANATGTNKDAMTKEQADVMIRLLQRIEQKSNVITPSVALGQVMSRSANLYART